MKTIVDRIGKPALLEQTAEECTELAHACLKEARRLRGENPTPKTTPECWLAISEELTDLQICIEMLEAAGYYGDPAIADVKRQRMVQRLDEAGKRGAMSKKCLDCAKRQQINGWRVAREAYSLLWPILINNKAATLELTEKQIQGLLDVTEEMTNIICGAEESGMNISEYAEYISGKADECRARLEAKP